MTSNAFQIRFTDLVAQQKRILPAINNRIADVLSHGQYIMGPEVFELEENLGAFSGSKHVITCSSGTDALLMALMAMGVGPGDAVFTTPFSFVATAEVIALSGATPIFVDVKPDTFNMDPVCLEEAIISLISGGNHPLPKIKKIRELSPKGILPVDLFGLPADYDAINMIADKYNLAVLADAAQSFGATYRGKKACKSPQVAATSFFPSKPLGCYGDGGALFTDDDPLAERIKSLRVHGKGADKYDNIRIGVNGRLDTIQAAVLLEKLKVFEEENQKRNLVASQYQNSLGASFVTQCVAQDCTSAWAQFALVHSKRASIIDVLKNNGIPTAIYYPKPLHCQKAFSYLGYLPDDFPVSKKLSENIFNLPIHPYLKREHQENICDLIHSALN